MNPGDVAQILGSVEVVPCKWAERGVPRLVPDPRPSMMQALRLKGGHHQPTPDKFIIVIHPKDVDRLGFAAQSENL